MHKLGWQEDWCGQAQQLTALTVFANALAYQINLRLIFIRESFSFINGAKMDDGDQCAF
jgi:hypothetical protein